MLERPPLSLTNIEPAASVLESCTIAQNGTPRGNNFFSARFSLAHSFGTELWTASNFESDSELRVRGGSSQAVAFLFRAMVLAIVVVSPSPLAVAGALSTSATESNIEMRDTTTLTAADASASPHILLSSVRASTIDDGDAPLASLVTMAVTHGIGVTSLPPEMCKLLKLQALCKRMETERVAGGHRVFVYDVTTPDQSRFLRVIQSRKDNYTSILFVFQNPHDREDFAYFVTSPKGLLDMAFRKQAGGAPVLIPKSVAKPIFESERTFWLSRGQ